jgi:hypothetical protein
MTKSILLRGGPRDGEFAVIDSSLDEYTILRELAPGKKMVLLGFERGYYRRTLKGEQGKEVYNWAGWEGEKN